MFVHRVTLRGVFLILAVIAGLCAAVASPSELIASSFFTGCLLLVPILLMGAILQRAEQRAFCVGALTCGLYYGLLVWWLSPELVTTQAVRAAYREYHDIDRMVTMTQADVEEELERRERQFLFYSQKHAAKLKSTYLAKFAELSRYRNEYFAAVMGNCALGVLFGYIGGVISVSLLQRTKRNRDSAATN